MLGSLFWVLYINPFPNLLHSAMPNNLLLKVSHLK